MARLAGRHPGQWHSLDDDEPDIVRCWSVGWLIRDELDFKVIVPHVGDGDAQECGEIPIRHEPRYMVSASVMTWPIASMIRFSRVVIIDGRVALIRLMRSKVEDLSNGRF